MKDEVNDKSRQLGSFLFFVTLDEKKMNLL